MEFHFENPVTGEQLKVTAQLVGRGESAYYVHIWEMPYWEGKDSVAVFNIGLNGKIQKRENEKNSEYCIKNKLSEIILSKVKISI